MSSILAECIHCQMKFDPEREGRPTDDGHGTFSGWFLPPGAPRPERHRHELDTCAYCSADVDPDDGTFCEEGCRLQFARECGE